MPSADRKDVREQPASASAGAGRAGQAIRYEDQDQRIVGMLGKRCF